MNTHLKRTFVAAALLGAVALPTAALAHGHVDVGIGLNLGGPAYVAPAPVYAPPPVYYDPPVVYDAPPPAYYAPPVVYEERPYYHHYHHRCWWEDGYRVCR